ncbi:hypothetical protein GOV03_02545, partial [Candidatus Woesearchaeota archaeon]|nr:hypothetical protein [Candidatus Woesearchaeota archaeon]
MEEIIRPGTIPEVEFRFTLKNKGQGTIQQARLGQARLANQPLNCEFKNNPHYDKRTFEFKEEQEVILICKKQLEEQRSYSTSLFLDLSFTYSLKERKKIILNR